MAAQALAQQRISRRTYTYQAPQYFLTGADGPWGELAWTYDKIGNRLSETRDGATDSYVYTSNGTGGNTPILDAINLAVGGTRDYTWGPAGHLDEVDAAGNVIDFANDAEGRLATTARAVADVSAAYNYDGRSFLTRAVETTGDPPAEAASVESVYDSGGVVYALRRQASPTDPQELVVHFYVAGRPVAQLAIFGGGGETWSYLTTDHLGTPVLATDVAGAVTWEGGLEPFGRDYQAGTPAGALENGVYLRLPGQWEEGTWADATSGAEVYYNVHRWYQPGTGRYTRPDPLGLNDDDYNLYGYAVENPLRFIDPLGQVALAPGEKCRGFPRVHRKLQRLKDNCECVKFFREELGADLAELIDGPSPVIRLKEGTPGGRTPCEEDPGAIWVDPKFCRLGNRGKLPNIILHELGHYADCDEQRFPPRSPTEEGAEAERACFGFSIDAEVR